jgi:hypothetical protein
MGDDIERIYKLSLKQNVNGLLPFKLFDVPCMLNLELQLTTKGITRMAVGWPFVHKAFSITNYLLLSYLW